MKTWRVEVLPRVEQRLTEILLYIGRDPLHNPEAARALFEDFEATRETVARMGDRVPIGEYPIMRDRALRRINFRAHNYYLIYRIKDDTAQIVRIAHFREDSDRILK